MRNKSFARSALLRDGPAAQGIIFCAFNGTAKAVP
jgi:hypothetical protein